MKRKLISLIIALSFVVIFVTGVLMYFRPFESTVASLHTSFGFVFLLGAVFHILNNILPLKNYSTDKKSKFFLSKSFIYLSVFISLLSYSFYTGSFGFGIVYDWGSEYRNTQLGKERMSKNVEYISLSKTVGNYSLEIEGKLGNAFNYPMFALWIEDVNGNYIQSVYVSESIGTSIFDYKKGKKGKHIIRRPSGLPVWGHKRNIRAEDGLMIPLGNEPDLDGYTGATPLEDFIIESNFNINKDSIINMFFEVNQSYDWNEYYSEDRFPQDSIYTISGQSGQPSLVFKSTINLLNIDVKSAFIMTPIGHGHHSGEDGKLYTDLSKITSAHNIVQRVILTLKNNK